MFSGGPGGGGVVFAAIDKEERHSKFSEFCSEKQLGGDKPQRPSVSLNTRRALKSTPVKTSSCAASHTKNHKLKIHQRKVAEIERDTDRSQPEFAEEQNRFNHGGLVRRGGGGTHHAVKHWTHSQKYLCFQVDFP